MTLRDIPNLITLLRIIFVVPLVFLLLAERHGAALVLFAILGASDAVDGYLARRFGWMTPLGAALDPIADKVLLVTSFLALGTTGLLPVWLVTLVIGRDLVIVGGALAYRFLFGALDMRPTRLSKANTLLQIILVLEVVLASAVGGLPPVLYHGLMSLVTVTTVASGVDYVWVWGRKAWCLGGRNRD